ncbi:hypothetical protein SPFM6_00111 [Salmonella phage SPFM6]|nr:hypothetical protein SPFM6_00111 [Salmonella phage SPFM6]
MLLEVFALILRQILVCLRNCVGVVYNLSFNNTSILFMEVIRVWVIRSRMGFSLNIVARGEVVVDVNSSLQNERTMSINIVRLVNKLLSTLSGRGF